jgi:hypothetical protein
MADTTVALDLTIDSNVADTTAQVDGLTQSIQQNTDAVQTGKQAYAEFRGETRAGIGNLLSLKKGTAEYNAELQKLASHKAEFQELQIQLSALNPNERAGEWARMGQMATKAIQGIGGALVLAAGGNDEMVKTFIKTQAAVEVLNSLQEIQRLRVMALAQAQLFLNFVTNQWPIAILIAGVVAAIAYFKLMQVDTEKLTKLLDAQIESLKEESKTIKDHSEIAKKALQGEIDLLEAEGVSLDNLRGKREEIYQLDIKEAKEQQENAEKQLSAEERRVALDKEYREGLKVEQSIQNIKFQLEQDKRSKITETQGRSVALTEQLSKLEDKLLLNEGFQKKKKELEEYNTQLEKAGSNLEDATNKEKIFNAKNATEDEKKEADRQARLKKERDQIGLDNLQRAEDDAKYYGQTIEKELGIDLELAKSKGVQIVAQLAANEAFKTKTLKEESDIRNDIRKKEAEIAGSIAEDLISIGSLLQQKGKEQNDVQKGLAITAIAIKEAVSIATLVQAIIAANAETPTAATPFIIAGEIASGIAGVLATFVSVKSILDGGSTSSTATPTFSAGNTTAPSFAATQNNGIPQQNANGNIDYGAGGAMTKIYVTQTDLTQSQQLAYIQNQRRRIH